MLTRIEIDKSKLTKDEELALVTARNSVITLTKERDGHATMLVNCQEALHVAEAQQHDLEQSLAEQVASR